MNRLPSRRALLLAAAGAAALAPWLPAHSQPKPIRLVVPFPAGGATDLFARALQTRLGEALGATVVIDNKPGAGGSLGSDIVAKAPADGLTLLLATTSTHTIGPALGVKLPYDTVRDFTPVVHVGNAPSVMLVPNASPAHSVKDFIALARAKPGRLNYGSSGNGTIVQLTAELFKAQAGIFVTHIPYKGTALAIPDLVSGNLDVMFDSLPTGMPHVRDKRLRALAVTSLQRSPLAPELPPVADTLPGFESVTWFGLFGPKGLPADVVQRLNTAVNTVIAQPEMRGKLAVLGIDRVGGTPAQLAKTAADELAKWKRIITERKISNE
ncbi:tripartite tricarboxylate transporter substrate binding protein [Ideonella sp. DXS22W]|uniref:Tripartite tricarboxylate transporter substrate binding protein n=1 Tax=Pseudaquabacterium inlustre TaxID=2984192 RepID=A0ABU9CH58_9BURK